MWVEPYKVARRPDKTRGTRWMREALVAALREAYGLCVYGFKAMLGMVCG